jgi:hypothetical protein
VDAFLARKTIVKVSQILSSFGLLADLKELDTDLPGLSIALVESLSRADDYRFDIILRDTVGDDDDVEGFHLLDGGTLGGKTSYSFYTIEVRFQDVVEARSGGGAAEGTHHIEDFVDSAGGLDVGVAALRCVPRVAVV